MEGGCIIEVHPSVSALIHLSLNPQVLNEDLVSCLFSKNWSVREIALKQLGELAKGSLLLGVGEGLMRAQLSSTRTDATHRTLQCACAVLAYMCADPVYKVFVAALVCLSVCLQFV